MAKLASIATARAGRPGRPGNMLTGEPPVAPAPPVPPKPVQMSKSAYIKPAKPKVKPRRPAASLTNPASPSHTRGQLYPSHPGSTSDRDRRLLLGGIAGCVGATHCMPRAVDPWTRSIIQ